MNNLAENHFNDDNNADSVNASSKLPIFNHRTEIIEAVKNNQFVIIHGETGCGKTTQVPQFLYEENLHDDKMIGITQPRKIAALSVARRVAKEMEVNLGKLVGYEIRFDKKIDGSTKIKYMTDGILFNECIIDKKLKEYSIIMIDEAHERAVISDVLLGILKLITVKNVKLKVIISSATISVEKFRNYFENAVVISVESRVHPVDVIYHDYSPDYIIQTVNIVQQIHQREMQLQEQGGSIKGDILVFLTGQEEIYLCCDELEKIDGVVPKPLCSAIKFDSQKEAFEPVQSYKTKVVVATNIAETSITIEGIKYVIDCGYVKQNRYNRSRGMEVLEDVRISKAQAEQRKGRAGRTQPGICHRLYLKSTYESFKEEAVPEIYRKNLTEICLKLRSFEIVPKEFDFIDSPKPEELARSDQELMDLDLLTRDGKLTGVGNRVAMLPLDPILGKVLITSLNHKCTSEVIIIVSMFSEKLQNIFNRNKKNGKQADLKLKEFYDPGGDHFTLLKVYNQWKDKKKSKQWCTDNFINSLTMEGVENVIKQIHHILKENKIMIIEKADINKREGTKKSFVAGYFKNICIKQPRDIYNRVFDEETFYIHGSSSLKDARPKIILFHDAIKSTKSFANGVMQLDEVFLRENFKKELEIIKFPKDINEPTSF